MEWREWLSTGSNLKFVLGLSPSQRRQVLMDHGFNSAEGSVEPPSHPREDRSRTSALIDLILSEKNDRSDQEMYSLIQDLLEKESLLKVSGGKAKNAASPGSANSSSILSIAAQKEKQREVNKLKEIYKEVPIATGAESYADYSKHGADIQVQKDSDGEFEIIITDEGKRNRLYTTTIMGNVTPGSRYVSTYIDISKGLTSWYDYVDVSKGWITVTAEKPNYAERANGEKVFTGYSHYDYSGSIKELVLPKTTKQNIASHEKKYIHDKTQDQLKEWKEDIKNPTALKETINDDVSVFKSIKTNRSLLAFVASEKLCLGYYTILRQINVSYKEAGSLKALTSDFDNNTKDPELIIGLDLLAIKENSAAISKSKKSIINEFNKVNELLNIYNKLSDGSIPKIYRKEKPIAKFIDAFGRGGKYHDDVPTTSVKRAKKKWKQGNHDFAENALKARASLAAKREELFYESEEEALANATEAYQKSLKQGDSQKQALANASSQYLSTLIHEDIKFLITGRVRAKKFWQQEMSELEQAGFWRLGEKKYMAIEATQWLLSIGADILKRQLRTSKKLWHDEHHTLGALRAEILLLRLSSENSLAKRYEAWYAKHPQKYYHPVKKWFAGAWYDIWHTLTLPYRAVRSEVKAWENGASFWGGISAGMHTEGSIFKKDIAGFNYTVKRFQDLIAPMFTWIPGVKKVVKVENLIGRAIESIPFNIVKNITHLEEQLWKVITLKATWAGIKAGLGRDTKSFRHLIHRIVWLTKNILEGKFKLIYKTIAKDVTELDEVAKLYFQEKEIKAAIIIEKHKLKLRKELHHKTHGLVRSPLQILGQKYYAKHPGSDKYFNQAEKSFKTAEKNLTALSTDLATWFNALTPKQQIQYYRDFKEGKISDTVISNDLRSIAPDKTNKIIDRANLLSSWLESAGGLSGLLTKYEDKINSRVITIALDGQLTSWADSLDKKTINQLKFAASHPNATVNAIVDYEMLRKLGELSKLNLLIKQETTDIKTDWTKWGDKDAKIALLGYETNLRPQFTVNYTTNPPTVTCSILSLKTSKQITSRLQAENAGFKIFRALMWSYVIKTNASAFSNIIATDQSLVSSDPVAKMMQTIALTKIESKFPSVRKKIKEEKLLLEVLGLPVSIFNKTNYKLFEAQSFGNLKLIELQAALAYDFAPQQGKNGPLHSRFYDMIHHNKAVYADYSADQAAEQGGADLTIGQILAGVMPTSSSSGGQTPKPTPTPTPSPTPGNRTRTANLLLLFRNYFFIKKLISPKPKFKKVTIEKMDEAENDKLFDSYQKFRREVLRIDNDVDEMETEAERDLEKAIKNEMEDNFEATTDGAKWENEFSEFDNVFIDTEDEVVTELTTDEAALDEEVTNVVTDLTEEAFA